jgi:methylenetetrahydrofolate reductase (NADPH)
MDQPATKIPISFEFFPPQTPEGEVKLRQVRTNLYKKSPEFCSVTYGAGGSTQDDTFSTIQQILNERVEAASHLSCVGANKERLKNSLVTLQTMGVKRLVVLRGDLPSGYGIRGTFVYASDLVKFIREHFGDAFRIKVACYPEVHPQAKNRVQDLRALMTKVEAGADAAITQYFFNTDAYFRFLEEVEKAGLNIPIVPGIMPITNSARLLRFSKNCGAEIPRWIRLRLLELEDDHQAIRDFGLEVVIKLCEKLLRGGVPALHFYTLNQAAPSLAICDALGI